jgi:hypothetical protein
MLAAFDDAREPLFQIIRNCSAPILQVSRYMTGDHYDFHEDEGAGVNLTAIVFLAARPEKVRGGDLVLAYRGAETTIRFRHNRLVIFPSKTPHRVTRVRVASSDPRDARISLQSWLAYGTAEKRKTKVAVTEADRPTFLLGDESITEAAQQLLDDGSRAQSPDVVYWGTFYLSRILTQNLRFLLTTIDDAEIGPFAIRRGESIEVFADVRLAGKRMRVGFELRGPEVPPYEALTLFAESDARRGRARLDLPPNANERDAIALLRRLVAKQR